MENRAHALAAGLFLMFLGAAVVAVIFWFAGDTGTRDKYLLVSKFPVTGLNSQSVVRYRGVSVGKVENIRLDPSDPHSIFILISVDRELPLSKNAFAQLGYQGLTGLAYVQLNDEGKQAERLKSDPANPAQISFRPSALDNVAEFGQHLLDNVDTLTERLNLLLSEQNQVQVSHILENTAVMTTRMREMLDVLEPGLKSLPELAAGTNSVLKNTDQLVTDLRQTAAQIKLNGGAAGTIVQAAEELGDTMQQLREAAAGVTSNTRTLDRFLLQLEEQPRSLLFGRSPPPPGPGEEGFQPPQGFNQ